MSDGVYARTVIPIECVWMRPPPKIVALASSYLYRQLLTLAFLFLLSLLPVCFPIGFSLYGFCERLRDLVVPNVDGHEQSARSARSYDREQLQ